MDDPKDIQKTQSISVFLDGHAVRTNPFGLNRAAERAYRRVERICAALYLLTAHIHEEESIRGDVRTLATGLLSDALSLRDEMRSVHSKHVIQLQSDVRHLVSLVRMLGVAGFISSQNAETMIEALDELGNFITASQRSPLSESVNISREELMDVGLVQTTQTRQPVIKDMTIGHVVKDIKPVSDSTKVSNTQPNPNGTVARVQNILDVLRTGGSLGIKDIAANLPEYSEKMIQRELLGMVSRGQVRKIGLKRWSKYSLSA
jgi:hypothetical protein